MSSDQQYPYGQPPYQPPYEDPHGQQPLQAADQTQTWQGETWDTRYQPVLRPAADPADPAYVSGRSATSAAGPMYGQTPAAAPDAAYGQVMPAAPDAAHLSAPHTPSGHAAEETAYLPPLPALSQPLPPEVHAPGSTAGHGGAAAAGHGPAVGQSHPPQGQEPGYGTGTGAGDTSAGSPGHTPAGRGPVPSGTAGGSALAAHGPMPAEAPGSGPVATAGYSPATLGGNARITDAQRARAEGRSPIIAPGTQPAGLTAALALLLAGGAALGPYALLVPLVLLQAVTAAGWFRLNGMWPARQGIALAFLGGLAADAVLLAAGDGNAPAAIIGTLGVWVLLTLVLQLRSNAGADERMYGLMATVASAAFAVLATGHLAAADDAVVVGAVSVAVATLARALPLGGVASVVLSLLAAAGAGVAAGGLTEMGTDGAVLGLVAGGCALIGLRVASYDYPSRFVHMTAGVALPLTAAAPAVYLIGRALA
ncbi:hypothetical protein [Streptomyces xantholiticus]|uniref:hypothetical protein n=1 Tax=Streptomyces xantholiticus TaxID=68285 RepID=UPI001674641F|nr:hypothetical protein [Streptomyces xantholiticus]GGW54063.1 hypothetical protein GCM10010381_44450 [Streptomyces xantholiticus]